MEVMCIWEVKDEERHCEYCTYRGGCESYEKVTPISEAVSIYSGILSALVGRDIMVKSRERNVVSARYILFYQLIKDGYSQEKIGKNCGFDHSTVLHGKRQVENMLRFPSMYPIEMVILQNFNKLIAK